MTLDMNAEYVSSPQAARILRITYVGVAQLARQGKIPAVKIANRWLIPRAFLDEFARTYEGKRGRPKKKRPSAVSSAVADTTAQPGLADTVRTPDVRPPVLESDGVLTVSARQTDIEATAAATSHQAVESPVGTTGPTSAPDSAPTDYAVLAVAGCPDQEETIQSAAPTPLESQPESAIRVAEIAAAPGPAPGASLDRGPCTRQPEDADTPAPVPGEAQTSGSSRAPEAVGSGRESDDTFSISAEVFHLDANYDFEIYEKGEITESARLIVARLKPKIPSLPQFSFRWDYRYEHLNVDIHGVQPNVKDWWTIGEHGYTGHLPRKLAGPDRAFEAIIWLPVTFVFRGRLTLKLRRNGLSDEEESPSVAATTGGFRRLWTKWSKTLSTQ